MPIPVAVLSTTDRLLGWRIRISQGKGEVAWMSVSCQCCLLSSKGLCVWPITRPEESYRLWVCPCVWSRNLSNEAALARVGLLRQRKNIYTDIYIYISSDLLIFWRQNAYHEISWGLLCPGFLGGVVLQLVTDVWWHVPKRRYPPTILCGVTSQKSEDDNHTAAEAWNVAGATWRRVSYEGGETVSTRHEDVRALPWFALK